MTRREMFRRFMGGSVAVGFTTLTKTPQGQDARICVYDIAPRNEYASVPDRRATTKYDTA